MFAEAFGVVLLILLIVITWRVVDSIMQAPGTSAALPHVSAPPAAAVGVLDMTMPPVDMSAYYPTSLAGTPAPTVPAATPVVTPPVVSTPAPVSKLLAYFNRMPPDAKLIGKPKNVPPTCPTGYEYGASMHCQSSTGTPPLFVSGTCPSGSQTVDTSTMPGQFKLPPQICTICPAGSTGLADGPDGGCISGV